MPSKQHSPLNLLFTALVLLGLLMPLHQHLDQLGALDAEFFGRVQMVELVSNFRYFVLHDQLFNKVIAAADGWLVHASAISTDDYQRSDPLTAEELALIQTRLQEVSDRLKAENIQLYLVVAPNKNTIYPEKVPAELKVLGDETRLDQLSAYLRANLDVPLLDLRPDLLAAKEDYQVYYRTDTHWNEIGAFIAYRAIAGRLAQDFPAVKPHALSDFSRVPLTYSGDMTRTAGNLHLKEESETLQPLFTPQADIDTHATDTEVLFDAYVTTDNPNAQLPRALIYRDSFFTDLLPFLAEHFSHAECFWTYDYNLSSDLQTQPDLVIIEFTERSIHQLLQSEIILE